MAELNDKVNIQLTTPGTVSPAPASSAAMSEEELLKKLSLMNMTREQFDALSDADKQAILKEAEKKSGETNFGIMGLSVEHEAGNETAGQAGVTETVPEQVAEAPTNEPATTIPEQVAETPTSEPEAITFDYANLTKEEADDQELVKNLNEAESEEARANILRVYRSRKEEFGLSEVKSEQANLLTNNSRVVSDNKMELATHNQYEEIADLSTWRSTKPGQKELYMNAQLDILMDKYGVAEADREKYRNMFKDEAIREQRGISLERWNSYSDAKKDRIRSTYKFDYTEYLGLVKMASAGLKPEDVSLLKESGRQANLAYDELSAVLEQLKKEKDPAIIAELEKKRDQLNASWLEKSALYNIETIDDDIKIADEEITFDDDEIFQKLKTEEFKLKHIETMYVERRSRLADKIAKNITLGGMEGFDGVSDDDVHVEGAQNNAGNASGGTSYVVKTDYITTIQNLDADAAPSSAIERDRYIFYEFTKSEKTRSGKVLKAINVCNDMFRDQSINSDDKTEYTTALIFNISKEDIEALVNSGQINEEQSAFIDKYLKNLRPSNMPPEQRVRASNATRNMLFMHSLVNPNNTYLNRLFAEKGAEFHNFGERGLWSDMMRSKMRPSISAAIEVIPKIENIDKADVTDISQIEDNELRTQGYFNTYIGRSAEKQLDIQNMTNEVAPHDESVYESQALAVKSHTIEKEAQVQFVQTYKVNSEENLDKDKAIEYGNKMSDAIEGIDKENQEDVYKILMSSKYVEVQEHTAGNIYKLDESVRDWAENYTKSLGIESVTNAIRTQPPVDASDNYSATTNTSSTNTTTAPNTTVYVSQIATSTARPVEAVGAVVSENNIQTQEVSKVAQVFEAMKTENKSVAECLDNLSSEKPSVQMAFFELLSDTDKKFAIAHMASYNISLLLELISSGKGASILALNLPLGARSRVLGFMLQSSDKDKYAATKYIRDNHLESQYPQILRQIRKNGDGKDVNAPHTHSFLG